MESRKIVYKMAMILVIVLMASAHPLLGGESIVNGSTTLLEGDDLVVDDTNSSANGTHKDLYVIKAVVYEIGILTEVDDNATDDDDYSHERVDLTFFDAHSNGSHFDLGNIPLPVQTNVTGQVLTGIAPVHIGSFQDAADIFSTLPLTGTIVNISHSDTSYITLSHAPSMGENGTILDSEDLAKIPGIDSDAIQIDNTPRFDGNASDGDGDDETDDDDEKAQARGSNAI